MNRRSSVGEGLRPRLCKSMNYSHPEQYDSEKVYSDLKLPLNETPLPYVVTSEITIQLVEPWGQSEYIGLTGIEVIDEQGMIIAPYETQFAAFPRDLASLGWTKDVRKLENLFFKDNLSTSSSCMWLVPLWYRNETPIIHVSDSRSYKWIVIMVATSSDLWITNLQL